MLIKDLHYQSNLDFLFNEEWKTRSDTYKFPCEFIISSAPLCRAGRLERMEEGGGMIMTCKVALVVDVFLVDSIQDSAWGGQAKPACR
jgi:hypothetical protein